MYWSREGLVGVQITLATASVMAAGMLALRILRRGERELEERRQLPPPVRDPFRGLGDRAQRLLAVGPDHLVAAGADAHQLDRDARRSRR